MESCVVCGKQCDYSGGTYISRCCCWGDFVCAECLDAKSLKDYVAVAVTVL